MRYEIYTHLPDMSGMILEDDYALHELEPDELKVAEHLEDKP
jgi:hypothetical protein